MLYRSYKGKFLTEFHFLRYDNNKKRLSCRVVYKLHVIIYSKEHGIRAPVRYFRPPPTERMIHYWRLQENNLRAAKKRNCKLRHQALHWPEIEEEIKMWIVDERSPGRVVTTKMIRNEARRLANEKVIQNYIGKEGEYYRLIKKGRVCQCVQKHQLLRQCNLTMISKYKNYINLSYMPEKELLLNPAR